MGWGRKKTPSAADKPRWNQDDYHKEFAGQLKEQIERGVAPWQKPWKPGESRLPKNIQNRQAVPGREFGLLERDPNGEGVQRLPLGHLQTDQGHGRAGPHGREGHARAVLQV